MSIYAKRIDYRKIWSDHNGAIPVDSDGRTFEIHHVDGNHSNNDPSNLIAVSMKEHYEIHYAQGDWAACSSMANRMNISPEEKSELAKRSNQMRVKNGTHHWLGDKNPSRKQAAAGTHIFIGGEIQSRSNQRRLANGTHHLLGGDQQRIVGQARVKNGTHNFLNPEKVTCPHCGLTSIKNGNMTRWHFDNCKLKPTSTD